MITAKTLLIAGAVLLPALRPEQKGPLKVDWKPLEEGLDLAELKAPLSSSGDRTITVLRIDPARFDLQLVSAKEPGEQLRTADEWARHRGLLACVNAGMYQMDMRTNVGYMKVRELVNNPKENKDNAVVAFGRKDDSVPPFQIIDRQAQDWSNLKEKYNYLSQGIRMIDLKQQNKWAQQDRKWSTVCIAADEQGRALFIFCRSPYTVHDLTDMLLAFPLDIRNAMYLEGGPEASFYLKHGAVEMKKCGSFETGFNENDDNQRYWPIPNMIGVKRK